MWSLRRIRARIECRAQEVLRAWIERPVLVRRTICGRLISYGSFRNRGNQGNGNATSANILSVPIAAKYRSMPGEMLGKHCVTRADGLHVQAMVVTSRDRERSTGP